MARFVFLLLALTACAPAVPTTPAALPPTPIPPTATPAITMVGTARVMGAVRSVSGEQVVLEDNQAFRVTGTTRYTRSQLGTPADLKAGQFAGITAQPQADGALLASIVNVFAPASTVPPGQRPMEGGNIMTNATIEVVEGRELTVAFPGGSARVVLALDARVVLNSAAALSDLRPGTTISAMVTDGVTQSVTLQQPNPR